MSAIYWRRTIFTHRLKKINTKFYHFCNKILQCLQQNSRIVCIYFLCMQKGEAIAHNNCTQTYLSLQSLYTNALFNHAKFFNWNWHQHDSDIGWGFLFAAPLFFNIPASPHFHSINLIRLSMARRWWLNSYTLFNIHNQVSTLHGCLLCFAIFLQFFVFFCVFCYYYWLVVLLLLLLHFIEHAHHISTQKLCHFP